MSAPVLVGPSPSGGGPAPSMAHMHAYPRALTGVPRTYITAREREALVLVANGNTNRAIGRALGLAENTVKTKVQSILKKLRASDRAHAASVAFRLGLISLDQVDVPEGANQGYRTPE